MEGYYDYGPQIALAAPLALSGYVVEDTRSVGLRLAALSGLTYHDLDRKIEHRAGRSIWQLAAVEGEVRYRQMERRLLTKILAERPPGIIVLGDGALLDPTNRRAIRRHTRWIHLDLDLANCYWRLRALGKGETDLWHPLMPGPLSGYASLRPFFLERESAFADAEERLQMRGQHPADIASRILESLTARTSETPTPPT